jgi:hypothetical protein
LISSKNRSQDLLLYLEDLNGPTSFFLLSTFELFKDKF